jgi:hypothetical protein
MIKINKIFKSGVHVEGYSIPVLNEREIRAAAGILFIMMFVAVLRVILLGDFLMLKYSVTIFATDILIRVFVNPGFSPLLIVGRLMVRNQVPEYVGAKQKIFAWKIGLAMATIIFIHVIIINAYSPITGILCLVCLVFLFFETAFGICLGCKFYSIFNKQQVQYCPGEVCERNAKQDIQKTSAVQVLIVLIFILCIFIAIRMFNADFSKKPHDLFGTESTFQHNIRKDDFDLTKSKST